jgi:hypothetical protein
MISRKLAARMATLLVVALVMLVPVAGALAGTPFTGGLGSSSGASTATSTTTSETTAAPVTLTTTSSGSGGLSVLDEAGIALVALIVFVSIAYVIRRDAHAHAPRHANFEIDRERGTVAPRTERIKRSRAKAKAARRARRARR